MRALPSSIAAVEADPRTDGMTREQVVAMAYTAVGAGIAIDEIDERARRARR